MPDTILSKGRELLQEKELDSNSSSCVLWHSRVSDKLLRVARFLSQFATAGREVADAGVLLSSPQCGHRFRRGQNSRRLQIFQARQQDARPEECIRAGLRERAARA